MKNKFSIKTFQLNHLGYIRTELSVLLNYEKYLLLILYQILE